jgi:hypothetical protein
MDWFDRPKRIESGVIHVQDSVEVHASAWAKKMVRGFVLALACTLAGAAGISKDKPPVTYQIPLPAAADFSQLEWLTGDWVGKTAASPSGEVQLSASFDLDKRILVLRGKVSLAETLAVPAMNETWLGIIDANPNGTGFTLRVFSSKGFMTRYQVTVEGPQIRLNPNGGDQPPPGWLFRRTWERSGPGEFTETVQAAPPNKPFFDYYTAKFTRQPPTEKPKSGQ